MKKLLFTLATGVFVLSFSANGEILRRSRGGGSTQEQHSNQPTQPTQIVQASANQAAPEVIATNNLLRLRNDYPHTDGSGWVFRDASGGPGMLAYTGTVLAGSQIDSTGFTRVPPIDPNKRYRLVVPADLSAYQWVEVPNNTPIQITGYFPPSHGQWTVTVRNIDARGNLVDPAPCRT